MWAKWATLSPYEGLMPPKKIEQKIENDNVFCFYRKWQRENEQGRIWEKVGKGRHYPINSPGGAYNNSIINITTDASRTVPLCHSPAIHIYPYNKFMFIAKTPSCTRAAPTPQIR